MTNPLLQPSALENELPDFANLRDEQYLPAFEHAVAEHNREIAAILAQSEVTFENTLVAMERSGDLLTTMLMVFYNKSSSDTNETMQALEAEIGPRLAAHMDSIRLNPALYSRITHLVDNRASLGLNPESDRLLSKYLEDFQFAGAGLSEESRKRVAQINERLSALEAEFDKRLLADTNDLAVELEDSSRLAGLTDDEIQSLAQAASERGKTGYVIPLLNYSGHPLIASLEDRSLRQELMERTLSRGSRGNANDTSSVIKELLDLRREKAALFGFANYAQYVLTQQTAKSPDRVHEVLRKIAPVAKRNANAALQPPCERCTRCPQATHCQFFLAAWCGHSADGYAPQPTRANARYLAAQCHAWRCPELAANLAIAGRHGVGRFAGAVQGHWPCDIESVQ